jgi:hypothetical protein
MGAYLMRVSHRRVLMVVYLMSVCLMRRSHDRVPVDVHLMG